jgi:hypothetical protein
VKEKRMRAWLPALVFTVLTCSFGLSVAAESPAQPRDSLNFFAGKWTLNGSESTYLEICEWLDTYLTCRGDERTESGTNSSLSIMGYSEEDQAFTHTSGFGGTPRTLRGWLRDGTWVFTGQHVSNARSRRVQVTITPTPNGFHFRQEISDNGGSWQPQYEFDYLRIP